MANFDTHVKHGQLEISLSYCVNAGNLRRSKKA